MVSYSDRAARPRPRHVACCEQLNNPVPGEHERSAEDLAADLGLSLKRLEHWVTRGWATASQRPFGRTWLIWADEQKLARLQQLARHQSGPGGVPRVVKKFERRSNGRINTRYMAPTCLTSADPCE